MKDINAVNSRVCEILKNENNEVIYKVWLSFAEETQFDGENLIITVPNNFIKEAVEDRYRQSLEALYRENFDFSMLLIKAADHHLNMSTASLSSTSPNNLQMSFIPEYKSYICW